MSKGKLIRDAVHGDIVMSSLEVELMDTPEFQRLRGIKQLGTAYLVFPSAVHTRFEHSLGTSWMAHRILQSVRRNESVSDDQESVIRVTALLHDLTHIPFGHTLEKHGMLRHDALSELINLLRIRYTLSERVYFHHSKVSSGAMISKAVELALREGLSVQELRTLRDETLIWMLRELYSRNPSVAH